MTLDGEKLSVLIERFQNYNISKELIDKFVDNLIIDHQRIDGYIATKSNYAPIWKEIDDQLGETDIETLSEGVGIKWHHSATLD